jgi:hypothetical protein
LFGGSLRAIAEPWSEEKVMIDRASRLRLVVLLACTFAAGASACARAEVVTNLAFVDGLNGWHLWAYGYGSGSYWGGAAGEWQADIDGARAMGYFATPGQTSMETGTRHDLDVMNGGYGAAWLMDHFAVGIADDWHPDGHSGYTETEARTAMSFAIFEILTSPPGEPLDLSGGTFYIWNGPLEARTLAQAYLDELTIADPDEAALEAQYDIFVGDQWPNAHWVTCDLPCEGDINGDAVINVLDLLALLNAWGACAECDEDVNGDGMVDVIDLLAILDAWGSCP